MNGLSPERGERRCSGLLTVKDPRLCLAYVIFTRDGKLLLGLASPYEERGIPTGTERDDREFKEALNLATSLLTELVERFGPPPGEQFGVTTLEAPPPLDTREIPAFLRESGKSFVLILPTGVAWTGKRPDSR